MTSLLKAQRVRIEMFENLHTPSKIDSSLDRASMPMTLLKLHQRVDDITTKLETQKKELEIKRKIEDFHFALAEVCVDILLDFRTK